MKQRVIRLMVVLLTSALASVGAAQALLPMTWVSSSFMKFLSRTSPRGDLRGVREGLDGSRRPAQT
jgi:hypothetical protein